MLLVWIMYCVNAGGYGSRVDADERTTCWTTCRRSAISHRLRTCATARRRRANAVRSGRRLVSAAAALWRSVPSGSSRSAHSASRPGSPPRMPRPTPLGRRPAGEGQRGIQGRRGHTHRGPHPGSDAEGRRDAGCGEGAADEYFAAQQAYFAASPRHDDLQAQADAQGAKADDAARQGRPGRRPALPQRRRRHLARALLRRAPPTAPTSCSPASARWTSSSSTTRRCTTEAVTARNSAQSLSDQADVARRRARSPAEGRRAEDGRRAGGRRRRAGRARRAVCEPRHDAGAARRPQGHDGQDRRRLPGGRGRAAEGSASARRPRRDRGGSGRRPQRRWRRRRQAAVGGRLAATPAGCRPSTAGSSSGYGPRTRPVRQRLCVERFPLRRRPRRRLRSGDLRRVQPARVDYAGYNGDYGNYIRIHHGGGIGTGLRAHHARRHPRRLRAVGQLGPGHRLRGQHRATRSAATCTSRSTSTASPINPVAVHGRARHLGLTPPHCEAGGRPPAADAGTGASSRLAYEAALGQCSPCSPKRDDRLGEERSASAASPHVVDLDPLVGLEILVVLEEVRDLLLRVLGDVVDVLDVRPARVLASTATSLSSPPASSLILSTPTGRTSR